MVGACWAWSEGVCHGLTEYTPKPDKDWLTLIFFSKQHGGVFGAVCPKDNKSKASIFPDNFSGYLLLLLSSSVHVCEQNSSRLVSICVSSSSSSSMAGVFDLTRIPGTKLIPFPQKAEQICRLLGCYVEPPERGIPGIGYFFQLLFTIYCPWNSKGLLPFV